ncbi:MAG: tRNA (adenosine(37)-N6)-threonylcarbamoyltransferase complex ATPase subunit type 1 TsaE [Micropruina sp.]
MLIAEAVLADGRTIRVRTADAADAAEIVRLVRSAFGHRPPVDPPAAGLSDTVASVRDRLIDGFGLIAEVAGAPVASMLVEVREGAARLTRVSVDPTAQRLGIATLLVNAVLDLLALRGATTVDVEARVEFGYIAAWWGRHGFVPVGGGAHTLLLRRALPVVAEAATADEMQALGRRLAGLLVAGDVIIASGDLGAGKTTLTQGIGAGLNVGGPVISPTFVLSRVHPPLAEGPALVHVDAYRLGSFGELEDLDLEASLAESVTLVEWGAGIAEGLSPERLEIDIRRGLDPEDETRLVFLTALGPRWAGIDLNEVTR